ncbi:hypothetical protein L6452_19075 [Arctium lappa]|uniref:Uncharacterized protein n=1 Tax=Arctium lappa TaxID=4217 RepID=A0ACB9B7Y8_ARCLA|nr:hypothetical protein L6452_19075 [Arctium lappa]
MLASILTLGCNSGIGAEVSAGGTLKALGISLGSSKLTNFSSSEEMLASILTLGCNSGIGAEVSAGGHAFCKGSTLTSRGLDILTTSLAIMAAISVGLGEFFYTCSSTIIGSSTMGAWVFLNLLIFLCKGCSADVS